MMPLPKYDAKNWKEYEIICSIEEGINSCKIEAVVNILLKLH